MRTDKNLAIQLRQQGKSYNQIKQLLRISKSTLSEWFRDSVESQQTTLLLSSSTNPRVAERIRKFAKANSEKWTRKREEARQEAALQFPKLIKNPLFISGITMYWAEGDNQLKNPVKFANTDPRMVTLFTKFATQAIEIPFAKLRVGLIIYPDIDPATCKEYWSKTLGIPQTQFHKTQIIQGKHPTRRLPNGVCMITLGSRLLKEKMLVWIDLLSKTL